MAPTQQFGEVSCVDVNSNVIAPSEKKNVSSPVVVSGNCIKYSSGHVLPNASINRNIPTNCQTISDISHEADSTREPSCINNNISSDKENAINSEVCKTLFVEQKGSSASLARRRRRRRLNCDNGAFNTLPTTNTNTNYLQDVDTSSLLSNTNDNNNTYIKNSENCCLQNARDTSHVITTQPDCELTPSQYRSSPITSTSECGSSPNTANNTCEVIEIGISQETQLLQNVPMLPIKRRNRRFMDDPFFEGAREYLEEAAKEVLDKHGRISDPQDCFKAYRKLLVINSDVKEAVAIFQSDDAHMVVLDGHGLARGNMVIKMLREDEIVIEGLKKKVTSGSTGTETYYQRRFRFPCPITSAQAFASADGVIYITVPKKERIESYSELNRVDCLSQSGSQNTDHGPIQISTSDTSNISENEESSLECGIETCHCMISSVFKKGMEERHSDSRERNATLPSENSPDTGDIPTPGPSSSLTQVHITKENEKHVTITQSVKSRPNCENTSLPFSKALSRESRQKHEETILVMIDIAKHVFCYLLILWMSAILMRSISHDSVVI